MLDLVFNRRHWWIPTALLSLVILAIGLVSVLSPTSTCWNGALSDNPLHCYVLEQAQKEGLIDVEALYVEGNDLLIYLQKEAPQTEEFRQFLREEATEFVERWPDRVLVPESYGPCSHHTDDRYFQCLLDITFVGRFATWIPWSGRYDRVRIRSIAERSVRDTPGWASWKQIWPVEQESPSYAYGDRFDISDVDTTNFPVPDCKSHYMTRNAWTSCSQWEQHPDIGIAHARFDGNTRYFAIKSPPTDVSELEVLKEKLAPGHKEHGIEVVIASSKYDFHELWRWTQLLNRFAFSAGNTVGITSARLAAIRVVVDGEPFRGSGQGSSRIEQIMISAIDPGRIEVARFQLLSQLGIPLEAISPITFPEGNPGVFLNTPADRSARNSNEEIRQDEGFGWLFDSLPWLLTAVGLAALSWAIFLIGRPRQLHT